MRKERILLFLGIWVAILPYLGFPYSWKNTLFTLSGLAVAYYSYTLNKESKIKIIPKKPSDDLIQNFNQPNHFDATNNF